MLFLLKVAMFGFPEELVNIRELKFKGIKEVAHGYGVRKQWS